MHVYPGAYVNEKVPFWVRLDYVYCGETAIDISPHGTVYIQYDLMLILYSCIPNLVTREGLILIEYRGGGVVYR